MPGMRGAAFAFALCSVAGIGGAHAACEPYTLTAKDRAALETTGLADAELQQRRQTVGKWITNGGPFSIFDPLWDDYGWVKPADRELPSGDYPVDIYVAELDGWGERNLLVTVKLGDGGVTEWPRVCFGAADPESSAAVGVDGGTIGIADMETVRAYEAAITEQIDAGKIQGAFDLHGATFEKQGYSVAGFFFQPRQDRRENIAMATIGAGDGGYPVYWGLDSAGAVALIAVDSGLTGEVKK